MKCKQVLGQLSPFLDHVLDPELTAEVSRHLRTCSGCNHEFDRLRSLQMTLGGLQQAETPDYLRHLVEMRISNARQRSWRSSLQSLWEYRWSRIRTTEGMWYLTRLAGAMTTVILFIAISSAINPLYLDLGDVLPLRSGVWQIQHQPSASIVDQLQRRLMANLGIRPRDTKKPSNSVEAKINPLYLVNFGESTSRTAQQDDTVSVLASVNSSGSARVQDILEYPVDDSLLSDFTEMITSAGWRPASHNGRAVDSQVVMMFSKVYVSN